MRKVERRRYIRVPGPFTALQVGKHDTPVRIVNLSEGGCSVESSGTPPPIGESVVLRISFPDQTSLVVRGEIVYTRPGIGYGVLFSGLSEGTYAELERAVARIRYLMP
jgi:hypothetical protein